MHSIKFSNWEEFKSDLVKTLLTSSGRLSIQDFLFRGQADSKWKLYSSFDRIEKDKSKYDLLLETFTNVCQTYNFNEDLFSKNDSQLVGAFAQHYGLPTRLLDWTTSPYFAAFFAFASAVSIKGKVCTVWAINKESEALKRHKGLKFISLSTNKYNYRMKNQLGHFTLSEHTEDSIDEFDTSLVKATSIDDLLWKVDINYTNPREVLSDLEIMGITHSFAYPDIEGYIEEAIYKTGLKR